MSETTMMETKTEETTEMVVEKPYKFRKLGSEDIFLMFKIISAIGINEFTACFGKDGILNLIKELKSEEKKKGGIGEKIVAVGVALEVANVILANIGRCKNEIYQLLEQTSNLTVEEIKAEGNAIMFLEMVIDFCKKDEFPAFIKVASALFK